MPTFPPLSPVTLQKAIASYLYVQYADDDDLQGFVEAYNQTSQNYLDTINNLDLPIYTGLQGSLLDWVAAGLYGITRPVLPSGQSRIIGPYNTAPYNTLPYNQLTSNAAQPVYVVIGGGIGEFVIGGTPIGGIVVLNPTYYATSDDDFKRVITWNFFKGDGNTFNVRWLKRRIARFLFGTDGVNYDVDQTYRVSVQFGVGSQVNIRILKNLRTIIGGAIFNEAPFNTVALDSLLSTNVVYPSIPSAPVFKAAMDAGVLQLPFQFDYVVTV